MATHMTEDEPSTLEALFDELVRARDIILAARRVPARNQVELRHARHDLVLALEAYTYALAAVGRPVPYALRDELRLQRGLDAPAGR